MLYASCIIEKIINSNKFSLIEIFSVKKKIYTFLNPVSYLEASRNQDLFCRFDGIFVDGSILTIALKLLYGRNITRKSFDLTSIAPKLFSYSIKNDKSIYIVASRKKELEKALKIFFQMYPNIKIIGYRDGYFLENEEIEKEVQNIIKINPDFLIVGMGVNIQEEFLAKVKENGFEGIGFTCGGFIHQTAKVGSVPYYPNWVNALNIRFLYRIVYEKHTRKRYLKAAIIFPIIFTKDRIKGIYRSLYNL